MVAVHRIRKVGGFGRRKVISEVSVGLGMEKEVKFSGHESLQVITYVESIGVRVPHRIMVHSPLRDDQNFKGQEQRMVSLTVFAMITVSLGIK